ncbi:hypothetical protein J6590_037701 [Homalodisca vitripennis]|nr:hypothetical protein J6590_037701 [Homalodisca vitripennis]
MIHCHSTSQLFKYELLPPLHLLSFLCFVITKWVGGVVRVVGSGEKTRHYERSIAGLSVLERDNNLVLDELAPSPSPTHHATPLVNLTLAANHLVTSRIGPKFPQCGNFCLGCNPGKLGHATRRYRPRYYPRGKRPPDYYVCIRRATNIRQLFINNRVILQPHNRTTPSFVNCGQIADYTADPGHRVIVVNESRHQGEMPLFDPSH